MGVVKASFFSKLIGAFSGAAGRLKGAAERLNTHTRRAVRTRGVEDGVAKRRHVVRGVGISVNSVICEQRSRNSKVSDRLDTLYRRVSRRCLGVERCGSGTTGLGKRGVYPSYRQRMSVGMDFYPCYKAPYPAPRPTGGIRGSVMSSSRSRSKDGKPRRAPTRRLRPRRRRARGTTRARPRPTRRRPIRRAPIRGRTVRRGWMATKWVVFASLPSGCDVVGVCYGLV